MTLYSLVPIERRNGIGVFDTIERLEPIEQICRIVFVTEMCVFRL